MFRLPGRVARTPACVGVIVLGIGAATSAQLRPETQPASEAFEVVSVRPRAEAAFRRATVAALPGGRFEAANATVASLIAYAYNIQRPQRVIGGSPWVRQQRFDVSAKTPESLANSVDAATPGSMRRLVQALLADRFKLVVHWEKREEAGRALLLARQDGRLGPNLTPSRIDCAAERAARATALVTADDAPGKPKAGSAQPPDCSVTTTNGHTAAVGQSMADFARTLSNLTGDTVVDRTGVNGTFDLELDAAPVIRNPAIQAEVLSKGIEFDAPPLEQALREQLGVRLEPIRLEIDILVIDGVEEPEPN